MCFIKTVGKAPIFFFSFKGEEQWLPWLPLTMSLPFESNTRDLCDRMLAMHPLEFLENNIKRNVVIFVYRMDAVILKYFDSI